MKFLITTLLLLAANGALAAQSIGLNVQPPKPHETATMLERTLEAGVRHVRASWWWWSKPSDWAWYPRFRREGIEVLPLVYAGPGDPDGAGPRMAPRHRALFDAYGSFR